MKLTLKTTLTAAYVLNLERRQDRMEAFQIQATKAGLEGRLEPRRIVGVDGRQIPVFNAGARPTESATTMGHRYIWALVLASQAPALVMEDDVQFCPKIRDHLEEELYIPDDCDILQLGMSWLTLEGGLGRTRRPKSGWGLFAYVLFPSGAEKMLRSEAKNPLGIADHYSSKTPSLNTCVIFPMWACAKNQDSDIAPRSSSTSRMGNNFEGDYKSVSDSELLDFLKNCKLNGLFTNDTAFIHQFINEKVASLSNQISPFYREYTKRYSKDSMCISFQAAICSYILCLFIRPSRILDLGSGFTSFIFRHYAQYAEHPCEVISVDDNKHWLNKTRAFLTECNLSHAKCYTIEEFDLSCPTAFDLIMHDYGSMDKRVEMLPRVLSLIHRGSFIIFDDLHKPNFKSQLQKHINVVKCDFMELPESTKDKYGRYIGVAYNFQGEPSKNPV